MIYQKPAGIKYTQMCIYIDNNVYKEDRDEEKIFQYLFHIYFMLAHKNNLFQTSQDYEEFSLYAASCMMLRYKNPKQGGKIKKIKSVLNWAKSAIYGLSVNFRNKQFLECIDESTVGEEGVSNLKSYFNFKASKPEQTLLNIEVENYFSYLPKTIMRMLKDSPYGNRKSDLHNIYISVLLSLISSITMSNHNARRILKNEYRSRYIYDLIDSVYKEESNSPPILIHLPQHMENYIKFLVSKVRKLISKDIAYLSGTHNLSDSTIKDILTPIIEDTEV